MVTDWLKDALAQVDRTNREAEDEGYPRIDERAQRNARHVLSILRADGLSWRKVAAALDAEGFQRRESAAPWTAAAAHRAARTVALDEQAAQAAGA